MNINIPVLAHGADVPNGRKVFGKRLLYISRIFGHEPGEIPPKDRALPEDLGDEIRQAFNNLLAALKATECGWDNVAVVRIELLLPQDEKPKDFSTRTKDVIDLVWKDSFPDGRFGGPAREVSYTPVLAAKSRVAVSIIGACD